MSTAQTKAKPVDKDDGILGDGLAEHARKSLRDRQARLDEILGETPKKVEPKPTTPVKPEKQRNERM